MDNFTLLFSKMLECLRVRITFAPFSFSFLDVFLALFAGNIVVYFVKRIFEE